MLVDVIKVEVKSGRVVDLTFEDGKRRVIDLEPYLHGPVFDEIRTSDDRFREVRIRDGTIAWPNEADIAPETLYLGLPPANRPLTPASTLRLKRFLKSADRFESRAPVSKRPLLQDPDISWFMGITVSIEFEKGALPHFRARYGETGGLCHPDAAETEGRHVPQGARIRPRVGRPSSQGTRRELDPVPARLAAETHRPVGVGGPQLVESFRAAYPERSAAESKDFPTLASGSLRRWLHLVTMWHLLSPC
jgi:hypothetical protein